MSGNALTVAIIFATIANVAAILPNASTTSTTEDAIKDELMDKMNSEVSVVALALLVFLMLTFYFVKAPATIVVENTWSMLSLGASIFCAVLANDVMAELDDKIFTGKKNYEPKINSFILWILWWLSAIVILYVARRSPLHLAAYGTVLGHILGFAGINYFGILCTDTSGPWYVLLVYLFFIPMFLLLFACGAIFRKCKMTKEELDRVHDQVKDTGNDFFCMTGSFILSYWIRFLITNPTNPTIDGSEEGRSKADVYHLLGVGIICTVVAGLLAFIKHHVKIPDTLSDMISTTISLLAAWCCLFGTNWAMFNNGGATVLNRTFVAVLFTSIAFAFILMTAFLIDHCGADKSILKSLFTAISLTVGMGWEKMMDACMDGLADYVGSESGGTWVKAIVFLIVFPAWVLYILPNGDSELSKIPVQHFWTCCPCCELDLEDLEENMDEEDEYVQADGDHDLSEARQLVRREDMKQEDML